MKFTKNILFVLLLLSCATVKAHDFAVMIEEQKVFFNIVDNDKLTAEVTYNGSIADKQPTYFEGELNIPAKVKVENTVYSVVGISPKAFSGADKLTGVILPSGLTSIGDFAFEGCTSLRKVIFPGNIVKFGQGVFFKCDKIQYVSFGSDWKQVDLKMFRWSDSLTFVTIPPKMEKIHNMKSLKHLTAVHVDGNNLNFTSVDGLLYDKKQETFYGCPRAYKGRVIIAEGTKQIIHGALIDCKSITAVELPETLSSVSFREFVRMADLQEIVFRGTTPIMTAKMKNGEEVFLLQVMNTDVKIIVPKSAKKVYAEALVQQPGEYMEINEILPLMVEANKLPQIRNILGVKNYKKQSFKK